MQSVPKSFIEVTTYEVAILCASLVELPVAVVMKTKGYPLLSRVTMSSREDLDEKGRELHRRLLRRNDLNVWAEFAELFFEPLRRALRSERFSPDDLDQAAIDSVQKFIRFPKRYKPGRSGVLSYLIMDARRDLQNLRARERKFVSIDGSDAEQIMEAPDHHRSPEDELLEKNSRIVRVLDSALKDLLDRKVLEMMKEGIRETQQYAEVLGLTGLKEKEQRRKVNRVKDRIRKKLLRPAILRFPEWVRNSLRWFNGKKKDRH